MHQGIICNNHQLHFETTSEMKKFIDEIQLDWVTEIKAMNNKFDSCFVANLVELTDRPIINPNPFDYQKFTYPIHNTLILNDLEKLKTFHKLAEKNLMDNELVKLTLSRQEIKDFYKNVNVVYSWKFRKILYEKFTERMGGYSPFGNHFVKFHIEFEEADDVYFYKKQKLQESLGKIFNHVELETTFTNWGNICKTKHQIWIIFIR
jgi:ABC-type antimicrobial peptide transport system permease subunit